MSDNRRDRAMEGLDPGIKEMLSDWGAQKRVAPEDPAWDVMSAIARGIQSADEANQAASMLNTAVQSIPSKIEFGARRAGRELREELSREFVTITKSYLRFQKLVSFAAAGGIILLAIIVGAVFGWLGLAISGHVIPTGYKIRSMPGGGVEIQAPGPGPINMRWCDQSRRNCLILKTEEEAK
ncbi:MAG: hypothetical protein JXR29_03865 [Methylothermaceae bacterium]|nr:hypothetical protein [Methylothermaceae bacterium]